MLRRLVFVALVLVLVGIGVAGYLAWRVQRLRAWAQAPHAVTAELVVEVPAGAGPRKVGEMLAAVGAIEDAKSFQQYLRWVRRVGGKLRAGEYQFKPDAAQSPDQIIDRLLKGEVIQVKVTIPEGLRSDEQAPIFEAAGFGPAAEYVRLARDAAHARSLDVEADSLEGYLFPDTYLLPRKTTIAEIQKLMVERFRKAWTAAETQRLASVTLDQRQAVTLASIVEKETGQPDERPRISCVFHNRLQKGMKLQTDPTVIYDIIRRTGSFNGNIRRVDLETPGPYNTYQIAGLPPGPIANAGYAALAAALNPMTCDDLFFVSRNDGSHVFCPTLACHEENVQRWQRDFFRKKRAENVER